MFVAIRRVLGSQGLFQLPTPACGRRSGHDAHEATNSVGCRHTKQLISWVVGTTAARSVISVDIQHPPLPSKILRPRTTCCPRRAEADAPASACMPPDQPAAVAVSFSRRRCSDTLRPAPGGTCLRFRRHWRHPGHMQVPQRR